MATRVRLHLPATKLLALAATLGYLALCVPNCGEMSTANLDTPAFLSVARLSLLSTQFYTSDRPFAAPALFRLADLFHVRICMAQFFVSALSWLALACALPRLFVRPGSKAAAFAAPMLLSLSSAIISWNYIAISESLCFSLLAAVLAASIWVFHAPRRSALAWFMWAILLIIWGGTRDNVPYAIGEIGAALVLWGGVLVWRTRRANGILLSGTFMVLLAFGLTTLTKESGRWKVNLLNVINHRVLPDDAMRAEWISRFGMPDSPRLRTFAKKWAWEPVDGVDIREVVIWHPDRYNQQLNGFPSWLSQYGMDATTAYVLRHPVSSVAAAVGTYASMSASDYHFRNTHSLLSRVLSRLFFSTPVWLGASLIVPLLIVAFWVRGWRTLIWASALYVVALGQLIVSYHGDANGALRHTFIVGIISRISFVVLLCGAIDGRHKPRAAGQVAAEKPEPRELTAT